MLMLSAGVVNKPLLLPLRTQFDRDEWRIEPTNHAMAVNMVTKYHYAKQGSPIAQYAFGLFLRGDWTCYGVSWWIPAALGSVRRYNPGKESTSLVLHRLVIHPLVPTNGASYLLGRSIRLIKQDGRFDFLITYADTWREHTGAIYKATNWEYRGLSDPTEAWVKGGKLLTRRGGRQGKAMLNSDLMAAGYQSVGRYAKHVYTMQLKLRKQTQPRTLPMFDIPA